MRSVKIIALVECGSDKCFIDRSIVKALGSVTEELPVVKRVTDLDG